jgi:hypothetical protein
MNAAQLGSVKVPFEGAPPLFALQEESYAS